MYISTICKPLDCQVLGNLDPRKLRKTKLRSCKHSKIKCVDTMQYSGADMRAPCFCLFLLLLHIHQVNADSHGLFRFILVIFLLLILLQFKGTNEFTFECEMLGSVL